MAIAAPRPADLAAATPSARTRVAVAGATGYAGQELVRLLARHPAVTLTDAMSSAATSTPRPLPALARIWDGATPAQCQAVIAVKVREWLNDPRLRTYLRPETLFGKTKFSQYLGELPAKTRGDDDDDEAELPGVLSGANGQGTMR